MAAKVEMPSDPVALLALAEKKNGLRNVGSAPWHVKATYQELYDNGATKETGTFEEWWVSDKKLRITYASPSFNQTVYSTEAGGFRAGDQKWSNGSVLAARNSMFPFFPSDELLKNSKVSLFEKAAGASRLKCVSIDTSKPGAVGYSEVYCFSSNAPILRMFELSRGGNQSVYNGIVSFRGVYVARDIVVSSQGKPLVQVHLDTIEGLSEIDESSFIPPPAAVPILGGKVDLEPAVMAGRIIKKVPAEYPPALKSARIQGTVRLQATIRKDGTIGDVKAISGPQLLYPSAINAVSQWVYEPYLLNGEPVQVGTTINIVFGLGGYMSAN